jgi:hypothetical protein
MPPSQGGTAAAITPLFLPLSLPGDSATVAFDFRASPATLKTVNYARFQKHPSAGLIETSVQGFEHDSIKRNHHPGSISQRARRGKEKIRGDSINERTQITNTIEIPVRNGFDCPRLLVDEGLGSVSCGGGSDTARARPRWCLRSSSTFRHNHDTRSMYSRS